MQMRHPISQMPFGPSIVQQHYRVVMTFVYNSIKLLMKTKKKTHTQKSWSFSQKNG